MLSQDDSLRKENVETAAALKFIHRVQTNPEGQKPGAAQRFLPLWDSSSQREAFKAVPGSRRYLERRYSLRFLPAGCKFSLWLSP